MLPTGGTITTATIDGVQYRVHTFTEDGVFEVVAPLDVEYFLVGAGAAGRYNGSAPGQAGGGAAGRIRQNLGGTPLTVAPGLRPITVGKGGTPSTENQPINGRGGDTMALGLVAEGGLAPADGADASRGGDQGGDGGYVGGAADVAGGSGASAAQDGLPGTTPKGPATPGAFYDPDGQGLREFAAGGGGKRDTNIGAHPPFPGSGSGAARNVVSMEPGKDGIVIIRYQIEPISAVLDAHDAPDMALITATVRWPAITATLAGTGAPDRAAINVSVPISTTLHAADQPDRARIVARSSWPAIIAMLDAADGQDLALIRATVGWPAIVATMDAADPPDTALIVARVLAPALRYAFPGDPQGGVLAPSIRSGIIVRP